jgi:hypothetical protein
MPIRPALLLLLAFFLLAACRAEKAPPPAAETRAADAALAAAPAELTVTGQTAFRGASSYFCVPHGDGGLQVDFRTGNAGMPAVAVRIESYRGSGPYQARLFVTGRSPTGGLVTSVGEASVDVRQQNPIEAGAPAAVSGTFRGRYDGAAGAGSVAGRFAPCNYSPSLGGTSPPVAAAATSAMGGAGGTDEQLAGAAEEKNERPSDASRLPARPRVGHGGARDRPAATGRRGHRARRADGGRRPRGRRGRGKGLRGAG